MKKTLLICLLALVTVSMAVSYGCSKKEGTSDSEGGMEKMSETMDGHGKEMESHEMGEEHMGGAEEGGAAMKTQQETMDRMSGEWMKARAAAIAGNPKEAAGPAKNMADAAAHMDTFTLHRNSGNREDFLSRAHDFKSLIMRFEAYAQQGNTRALREIAPKIDSACSECHNAFR